jgi:hypothetical protein
MEFELQGLKVKIEGSREDASLITQNLGGQIAGVLQPMAHIIEGSTATPDSSDIPIVDAPSKKLRKRRPSPPAQQASKVESAAIDFETSPEKFGVPRQNWNTADKASWLIYVLGENNKGNQQTTRSIVETFNKHFRQSGLITTGNVNRDLGRLKTSRPPQMGEDATKSPPAWFLTDEGRKRVQQLIAVALGNSE